MRHLEPNFEATGIGWMCRSRIWRREGLKVPQTRQKRVLSELSARGRIASFL